MMQATIENRMMNIRGRSDKYLASSREYATIAREIYYCAVHSRRRLLSKLQSNRTRCFVLIACGNGRVREFYKKWKKQYRSVMRFLFLEGNSHSEIKKRLDAVYGDSSPSMATVKNWFNEFQRGRTSVRFLISHTQVPQNRIPRRIT